MAGVEDWNDFKIIAKEHSRENTFSNTAYPGYLFYVQVQVTFSTLYWRSQSMARIMRGLLISSSAAFVWHLFHIEIRPLISDQIYQPTSIMKRKKTLFFMQERHNDMFFYSQGGRHSLQPASPH